MEVFYESIADFDNLKQNRFNLSGDIATHGWEVYFNRLKGLVYHALVEYFWFHAEATDVQVFSSVLGQKIQISKKSIAKLLNHDGFEKRCYQMFKNGEMSEVVSTIFQKGSYSDVKNFKSKSRIWAKILLGCIHHYVVGNSVDYINTD